MAETKRQKRLIIIKHIATFIVTIYYCDGDEYELILEKKRIFGNPKELFRMTFLGKDGQSMYGMKKLYGDFKSGNVKKPESE
jgi:hypothetical protein